MIKNERLEDFWREQEMLAANGPPEIWSRESIWVTMTKQRIAIKDMADSHLLNTIRMLEGRSPKGTQFRAPLHVRWTLLNVMANEAYRRRLELLDHERAK